VTLLVDDTALELGAFSPGQSRFVLLPMRGKATFRIRYSVGGGEFTQCSESIASNRYHVYAAVQPSLMADCHAERRIFARRFVPWALWR